MAEQYQKPYLDSSVFIAWIKGEVITKTEAPKKRGETPVVTKIDRKRIVNHILKLAEKGDFKIYSSTLALAEVHKKRNHPQLDPDQDEKILAFFENDFIELIDVDRRIGEEANRICRDHGLLPADAIHLACALRAGCDVLLAWDDRLNSVVHPKIRIEEPVIIGQMQLDELRQPNKRGL